MSRPVRTRRASDPEVRRRLIYAARLAVVTAAYFGSAKAGLALAFANSSVTAIWPPTGLALAVILLGGYRMWPAIALGAFLSNVTTPAPLGSVLGITAGNTLEALLGAYLLSRVGFNRSLERMRDVVALVVLAGVLSTMASATVGVLSLWAGGAVAGDALLSTWRVWWLGDMGGDLLVAPAVLVLASRPQFELRLAWASEVALLTAGLVLVSALVFPYDSPLAYVIFPLLFWTALRFRQPGAVLASLLVSSVAVWYTARGNGPFVGGSPDANLLRAQTFVGVAAITALLVAAVRSERYRAESALTLLADAEEKFRQLLEFAPDAIIGVGADGRIELINSQVEQLFGYSREELIGEQLDALVPERYRGVHPGHREGYFRNPHTRPMGAGLELFARRKDGSEFPCEISLSSIHAEHGTIAVAAVRDVTERKRAEAEADRLKSEFFALVSHELRTPLTSIVGYVDLLRERERERLSSPSQEFLRVIERNTKRLDDLVQDVLLVAQIEAGTFSVEMGEVKLSDLVAQYEPEARLAAASAGVELAFDLQEVPPFAGDAKRLGQVLSNLVSNALKFTPPGGRVGVRIAPKGSSCLVEVSDTGVGIEHAELEKLFNRFYRSKAAEHGQVKGTGLGLAIVKTIVEAHDGTIEVESEPGKDTTFRVVLPMKPRAKTEQARKTAGVSARVGVWPTRNRGFASTSRPR